ncbi:hypothetical protein DPMN_112508 [Dreissena polymorpha]|uniref:Integrase zinc-binding domain-containing protein n=1 Tax=Dreissena polymorpha TaxID=45954 RepID=A0A9D4QPT7_DREPO|nr:hypothetical protein DPMN_112508 [Dreissena polymorpha]
MPKVIREAVVRQSHKSVTAVHQAVRKTNAMLVRSIYWFNQKTDIRLYIQACVVCERDKTPNKKSTATMGHHVPFDQAPFCVVCAFSAAILNSICSTI